MRDPELVARAGYAAARLEQAWERWRALHGLGGSADPLASYVGYSLKEPMGQPRVVIGVDAAEAEFFADFLESHDCSAPGTVSGLVADVSPAPGAGLMAGEPRPVNGAHPLANGAHPSVNGAHPPVSGPLLPPVSGPQRVMASGSGRVPGFTPISGPFSTSPAGAAPATGPLDPEPATGPGDVLTARGTGPEGPLGAPVGLDYPGGGPAGAPVPVTGVFPATPADRPEYPGPGEPMPGLAEPPDAMAAEMAGWSSGELPGQASEQLASWVAGESGARRLRRTRSAR